MGAARRECGHGSSGSGVNLGVHKVPVFNRKVKKQLLKEVVGNDKWHVNKPDENHTPLPVKEITRHAERWIDREVPYDVLGSNCEHFVTELHYGEGVSDQAKKAVHRGHRISVAMTVIGAAGVFCGPFAAAVYGVALASIGFDIASLLKIF